MVYHDTTFLGVFFYIGVGNYYIGTMQFYSIAQLMAQVIGGGILGAHVVIGSAPAYGLYFEFASTPIGRC